MNYLFSAIDPSYVHKDLFGLGAIFDVEAGQQGWDEIQDIKIGDKAAVINSKRKVPVLYEVTKIEKSDRQVIVFGEIVKRVDMHYEKFIRQHQITNSRISPSHQMRQGFNVAVWE